MQPVNVFGQIKSEQVKKTEQTNKKRLCSTFYGAAQALIFFLFYRYFTGFKTLMPALKVPDL